MTHTGVRSRFAGIFAGAGALSLLLGTAALLVAPQANADQTTNGHNPPGNNGTVKIEDADIQSGPPDNNPHQGCTFSVEFYNYDKGDYYATVTFEDQAPTKDGGLQVVSGNLHPFIGGDPAGGGNDLDAREVYTLKFTGQPQPQQGYHVKLTVNAPGSIGADKKHKVFWVQGCDAPPTTTPPPTTPPTSTDTPPVTTDTPPATTDTPPATTDTPPATTDTPPATTGTPPATTDTPPATTAPPATTGTPPATTPASPGTSGTPTSSTSVPAAGGPSETPTGGVPTEVDAGFGGSAGNSLAGGNGPFGLVGGLLLAAGGAMLAGGGFVALRRRGKHSH
ncbi:hypothetical protein [Kribbella sp.]|uniref:hypothetical protein n=1 Tax=Kribbella sp. TaxID=1871183 RepID=UPI002D5E609C|nr:hypothetical protein [Kribbella sp.]HZX06642.1 hypothetical protein [Kribbella sp.]